jgi:hypothetical protein
VVLRQKLVQNVRESLQRSVHDQISYLLSHVGSWQM